jgi:hypothetical protein
MRKSCFLLAVACLAPSVALADNGAFGNLSSVTSTGALGNLSSYIGAGDYFYVFNTDNGNLYSYASGGYVEATLPYTTVQQYAGGPTLHVFNFANFDSGTNANYTIVGSQPAVIAATGNITIAANVSVTSGGGAGGIGGFTNYPTTYQNNGYSGGNPGGAAGGQGPGVDFGGVYGGYSGGPGGGGGSVSPGQSGSNGTVQTGEQPGTLGYSNAGGAGGSPQDTSILQGGGGGGGGAGGYFPGETDPGTPGGAGGAACSSLHQEILRSITAPRYMPMAEMAQPLT